MTVRRLLELLAPKRPLLRAALTLHALPCALLAAADADADAATLTLKPAFTPESNVSLAPRPGFMFTVLDSMRFVDGYQGARLGFIYTQTLPQFGHVACWGRPLRVPPRGQTPGSDCQVMVAQRGRKMRLINNTSLRVRVRYR